MSTLPISRADFTPPARLRAARVERIVSHNPLKFELAAIYLCDADKGDGLSSANAVAIIRLSPALNEADAVALADRAVADPSLIGTDPRITKWEGMVSLA